MISESDLSAWESADSLQRHIEQQVEVDWSLARRLEALQLPSGVIELDDLGNFPTGELQELGDPEPVSTRPSLPRNPGHGDNDNESIPDTGLPVQVTFGVILSTTRVYDRVRDREVDDITSVLTTRSHALSVLSGRSQAEISVIAVIKLPRYEVELERFRRVTSRSWIASDTR
jgi:hypothetical protein